MIDDKILPEELIKLPNFVNNMWITWHHAGRELFRNMDYALWNTTRHNSYEMVKLLSQEELTKAGKNPKIQELYNELLTGYERAMDYSQHWFYNEINQNVSMDEPIAYFSMEFGIHQSLPIYSGGLGVLAGDTCKEASDLGIPFVAIGFLYDQGYFHQRIPPHGWQEAVFQKTDFSKVPMMPLVDEKGERVVLEVNIAGTIIHAIVWEVHVGLIRLFLLDTNTELNEPWFRTLSAKLYGGDQQMRINQELVLGIGGVKLLKKLNIKPRVWHLNEGHCSFLTVERITDYVREGMTYEEAFAKVKNSTVFTTHTPVPAGHDKFPLDMVEDKLLGKWQEMGISREEFLKLGINPGGEPTTFNMTVLGINTSHLVNGVSKLHTNVTEEMWDTIFNIRKGDTKLLPITNGVHMPTWIAGPMRRLFSEYVAKNWLTDQDNPEIWKNVVNIPDKEFWEARLESKKRLLAFMRETARRKRLEGKIGAEQILASGVFFDPEALTIGFARRFATYKRANLIFRDIKRLRKILNDPHRPVQIVFAGKAHPADEPGKHLLQKVYEEALAEENGGRIAFIEDYDMLSGRYLVQGVDVWLNNPIRPHEASGTSGIKAAANGIPHFSILDGWWAEGYNGENGWAIGDGEERSDPEERDRQDVISLYEILENDIVPKYYQRNEEGYSEEWIKIAKESIKSVTPEFSMTRMIKQYVTDMYVPTFK